MSDKIIRITTVPISLKILLKGQLGYMNSNSFEVIGVSSEGKELLEVEAREGIRIIPLELTRIISPIKDLVSLYKFYRLCKVEKPLIVHSHTPKAGIIGMLGAWLAGVPIRLHTVAGLPLMEIKGGKRRLLDFVEKLTYKCATKVYPNSKGLYQFILENKYTNDRKLKVIGEGSSNGIDTDFFSKDQMDGNTLINLKEELRISSEDFVYIFVGRLVRDKGLNELILAFDNLSKENKFLKLLLVGSFEADLDPLSNEVTYLISNNPNIIHVGFQNDVRPYFSISNLMVFPSYREGFPNVVMQAGAMGLPCIVSNINGCNEIINDGVNGLIIDVKSESSVFCKMKLLSEDRELYNKLQRNSRKLICDRYEQRVVWKAILDEYHDVVKQNVK